MLPGAEPRERDLRLVRQMELGDCGAACLATVLRAHGRDVGLAALRDLTSTGRDGVSALGLARAAEHLGLGATGVRCPADRLGELPRGAVLHWGGNHFVVLSGRSRRGLHVLDPALGRRTVPWSTVAEQYSGVALLLSVKDVPPPAAPLQVSRWARYGPLLADARRPAALALAAAAAVQAFTVVNPLVLREVVERAGGRASGTSLLALGVAALAVGFLLAQVGRLLCLTALQRLLDVRLSVEVMRHLARLPYAFLARRSTGDLALRVRSTVAVRQLLTATALSAVLDGLLVLGYLVVILVVDPLFALLTASAVLAQAAVVAVSWPRLRQAAAEALEAQTSAQNRLLELLSGLELLKASGAAPRVVDDWSGDLEREVMATLRSSRLAGLVDSVLVTLRFAAPPGLLVLGLARVDAGALTLADMLALAALAAAVTVPVGALLATVCALTSVAGYLDRLDDLLRAAPEPLGTQPVPQRLNGAVELRRVTHRYSSLGEPALEDVDLRIAPGEHVAVVGASGSGKTTMALLVATLLEPSAGSVLLDGLDARTLDRDALRARLGIVMQGTTLFATTLRDNVRLGRAWLTDDDVHAALALARLDADVAALPSGLDTRLGNGGSGLSGGQRQRLAIARAVIGRPGLLVLDEATSALDPVTEAAVHSALADLACTRLVVAHRLTNLAAADRVVVLEAGRVVADGTYGTLRRRSPELRALLVADGRIRSR